MEKKILHIIPSFEQGGAESMLKRIITKSENASVKHTAVYAKGSSSIIQTKKINYCNVGGFISLLKLIKKEKPDVIVGWLYLSNLIVCLLSLCLVDQKIKFYHNFRNVIDSTNPINFKRRVFLRFLSLVTKHRKIGCIYNSDVGLKSYQLYFEKADSNIVIENGFEQPPSEQGLELAEIVPFRQAYDYIICFPARYDSAKNQLFFISVIDTFITENSDFKVAAIMCGRGILTEFSQVVDEFGLNNPDSFYFCESLNQVHVLYQAADLVFVTSKTEAFPNVVGEAMLNECFIISSNVGDCKKIMGSNEWLYEVNDKEKAINLLSKFFNLKQQERDLIIKNNKERIVRFFSIEKILEKYNEL